MKPTKEQIEEVAGRIFILTHKGRILKFDLPLDAMAIRFLKYAKIAIEAWEKIRG